ncbi:MAG: nucleoside hydrolase, partial [Oscillospiraceae bacterium]
MNHRIPVLLDGDPGHDDAIAWMLAATGLDIRGVSSAAGNQTIEKTTRNALRICTLLGIRAPVAMGLARPLLSEALTAPSVHGVSGLDGPALPEPDREAAPESAPEQMARLLRESAEPLTIVATAPLTNVAALLLAHPELKANIAGISLMGGGLAHGNW